MDLGGRTYIRDRGGVGHRPGDGRPAPRRGRGRDGGADLVVPPDDVAEGKDESGRWAFTRVDVTDESSVAALVGSAVDFGGSVDGVLHAAGVVGGGPVHMLPEAEWARVIAGEPHRHVCRRQARHRGDARPAGARGRPARSSAVTVASIEGLEGTAGGHVPTACRRAAWSC